MISVYKLTQAINESASGVVIDDVAAYEFIGGLDEATSEMNYIMMSEAADIAYFKANAEEIMTEAAISNPSALEVLSENVFQSVGAKIKKFIDKVIAMVKGMIEKIKAFFFKLTGKTDKWLGVMRPRITTAAGYPGASDQPIELHKWDVDYISSTGGLISGLTQLAENMTHKTNETFDKVSTAQGFIKDAKDLYMRDSNRNTKDHPVTGDDVSGELKAMADKIEKLQSGKNKEGEDKAEVYTTQIASKLSVEGTSMDEIWTNVTKKATGGEKITMKYSEAASGKGVTGMLDAIEGSKKAITALKDAYTKHLQDLQKVKTAVENTFRNDKIEKFDEFPTELKGKYQSLITELSNDAVRNINILEGAMNTAKSKHIGFVQTMTSEYMSALSKFANYKGKKED